MKIIDLSVTLNEDTPVYPGDPATKIKPAGVIEKDGYNDHYISVAIHVGTHIDGPLHMISKGKTIADFPIDTFIGRGRYVKVENNFFELETVKKADMQEGDIVLFDTGMNNFYGTDGYFENYPEIGEEIAHYLVEKKVKIIGMDMCSPDYPPFKTHKILLDGGVLIIENLTNLSQLVGKEFTVFALPIKFQLDGAPARVIAQLKE